MGLRAQSVIARNIISEAIASLRGRRLSVGDAVRGDTDDKQEYDATERIH